VRHRRFSSPSSLQRDAVCPGNTVLPKYDRVGGRTGNHYGNAMHEWLATLAERGRGAANAALLGLVDKHNLTDDEHDWLLYVTERFDPDIPEGARAEVPLCLLESGEVIPAEGGHGRYAMPEDGVIAGTIDVVWTSEEGLLWCGDYKSGEDRFRVPVERDLQALAYAVMGARYWGATYVAPAVCYVRPGSLKSPLKGDWRVPKDPETGEPTALGPVQLAAAEEKIRAIVAGVREEHKRADAGKPPTLVTGPQCEYCDSRAFCPARTSEASALLSKRPMSPKEAARGLTPEQAVTLAVRLPMAAEVVGSARNALKAYVDANGPIELPDGRIWGPDGDTTTEIDAATAYAFLCQDAGEEYAAEAIGITGDGIKEAFRKAHAEKGIKRKVAPAVREFFGRLRVADAVRKVPRVVYRAHHPKPTLTEQLEASVAATDDAAE